MNNSPHKTNQNDYFTEEDYKTIIDIIENKPEQAGILHDSFGNDDERKDAKQEYKKAFSYFDKDNSGFIDSSELTYMLQSFGGMSSQDIRLLFGRELYKNNGFINYDQLLDKLFGA